jgi:hypothetical protein
VKTPWLLHPYALAGAHHSVLAADPFQIACSNTATAASPSRSTMSRITPGLKPMFADR